MTHLLQREKGQEWTAGGVHGDIMIVDDNPANLRLLEDMLVEEGHEVRSFPRGRLALAAAAKRPPDLILLDINMPEMNGYEVCQQLKSDPQLAAIPVIFLSALNETPDKIKAFQAGGVDYISKPFQFEEIHARVETHLKLHQLQQTLKLQNEHLEKTVAVRTRELAELNQRLRILDGSKNEFLGLISHEFRTPLNGLFGVGEIVFDQLEPTEENREFREMFDQSRKRILSILDDALLLTEIDVNGDQFRPGPVALQTLLNCAIERTAAFARSRHVTIPPPIELRGSVLGDENLLVRAVQSLLETAIKLSNQGETIGITQETLPEAIGIAIESQGTAIPEAGLAKFFDLFSISEAVTPGVNLGLGPPVAARILSLFGASVSVASCAPNGIRLTVSLKDAVEDGAKPEAILSPVR